MTLFQHSFNVYPKDLPTRVGRFTIKLEETEMFAVFFLVFLWHQLFYFTYSKLQGPCILKLVFIGENIREPVIKHEQSEKETSLRCKLQSLRTGWITLTSSGNRRKKWLLPPEFVLHTFLQASGKLLGLLIDILFRPFRATCFQFEHASKPSFWLITVDYNRCLPFSGIFA